MKKDDELWLKKMKEMLEDYNEPSPVGGWERLQKEITPSVNRRIHIYRMWAGVAAAIFMAVAGVSVYLVNSPAVEDIRNVAVREINTIPDQAPFIPNPEKASANSEPVKEISNKTYIAQVKTTIIEGSKSNEITEEIPEIIKIDDAEKQIVSDGTSEVNKEADPVVQDSAEERQARPSGKDKLHLPVQQDKKSASDGKWAVSLAFNSAAGGSLSDNQGNSGYESMQMKQFATIGQNASVDYLDMSNKEVVFNNGVPYYTTESHEYDHKQPITVGLAVRKRLSGNFSIETGVNYTYLLSDIYSLSAEKKSKMGEQKLHYIGIPLRVNWSFLNTDRFTLYLTAGGMLEKCVYSKTPLRESNSVKQLQASLAGGVGAQFNISRKIGIYAEPGVAYFFKDGSDVETIRKENPFSINLQAGIRLTY